MPYVSFVHRFLDRYQIHCESQDSRTLTLCCMLLLLLLLRLSSFHDGSESPDWSHYPLN